MRPAVVLVVLAIGMAIAVTIHPDPFPGEVSHVQWLQDVGNPVPAFADVVNVATSTEVALLVALLLGTWSVRRSTRQGALIILITASTMLVVQPVVKQLVDRPRPSSEIVEVRVTTESSSFPSGHSMSTTTVWGAVAAAAWCRRRRTLAAAAALPIALTFIAGGVLGAHWPTDAIGGTLLGGVAAWLIAPRLSSAPA